MVLLSGCRRDLLTLCVTDGVMLALAVCASTSLSIVTFRPAEPIGMLPAWAAAKDKPDIAGPIAPPAPREFGSNEPRRPDTRRAAPL